jgi:PAS domain S-box-containing protein
MVFIVPSEIPPSPESALAGSEARYRRLFETAQDAILILDAEQERATIADANPFVIDLLGYTLEELIGRELWEIGLFADKEESKAAMERLMKDGYIRYEDMPLETKDGRRVEVEFVSNLYEVGDRKVIQCNIRDITERAEAAHKLKASESRYRRLFETAQDAILILDAEQERATIADANPFVIDLLGYTLEELIGRELWEIGLFADKEESKAAMERLMKDGYIRYEDMPLETKDGRRVEVEFVSNLYEVGDRKVIQCNIRDITERAEAAHKLKASESRYRRLFETAQDAILILEEGSGKIMDANPFVIDLLGYSLDELIGRELWEIGLFADREQSKTAMEELQEIGYIRYEDMPLETKQGERVEVEFVSNSYMVGDEKVIQCNIRDITDRKWAERAALISAERFRFLAESMPLMIFTANPAGEIDYCNRQLAEFTGLPCEDVCRSGLWTTITHPDEMDESAREWRNAIDRGEQFQHEARFRRADGTYRWHLTRASAMRDAGGIVIWVGSSTDIDDRKSIEENLVRQYAESETLSRAKDEFLATSSHELRTPLTSILGWSELLVTGELDEETEREALNSIRDSARAQSRLIDDMLDVSRLLTGKLELNTEMVDVAATLLLALRAITPAAGTGTSAWRSRSPAMFPLSQATRPASSRSSGTSSRTP